MTPEKKNKDLYIDPIFDSRQMWIWTSDPCQDAKWIVDFVSGRCSDYYPYYNYVYVRAVRSAQSSQE